MLDICNECNGDGTSCLDCFGEPNGSATLDDCNVCNGGNLSCTDCNGDPNGIAVTDNCGDCVGGNSGKEPCVEDCNNVWGGKAYLDDCGTCVSGNTGNLPCVKDCLGNWGGNAVYDDCGECDGNNDCLLEIQLTSYADEKLYFTINNEFDELKKINVQIYTHINNSNNPIQNINNCYNHGDKLHDNVTFRILETPLVSQMDEKDNINYCLELDVSKDNNEFCVPLRGLFSSTLLEANVYTAFTGEIFDPKGVKGCFDETACNYNSKASIRDDRTCFYAAENHDCNGNCIVSVDCSGVCGGEDTSCLEGNKNKRTANKRLIAKDMLQIRKDRIEIIAGVSGDPHVLTFGGNRCELPHEVKDYILLDAGGIEISGNTVFRGEEALLEKIKVKYYNSEFTINLFSLNIVSKNNFDEEFIFNTKSLKTKEIKSRDNNLTFLLNSEVNGLLVKTKYDLNQENSNGILMSDELENCISLN